jgi:23S rRNA (pseudouridine1915-N3)-methyltransferase
MIKIKILSVGKTKEPWLDLALQEYQKRLKNTIAIQWQLYRDELELDEAMISCKNYIALDPHGTMFSSEEFSSFIFDVVEELGSRLDIVIGGSNGLSLSAKKGAKKLISFSRLTFTHQMTRILLLEQLYRALKIKEGSSYHK